jgi:hypothetical protein
VRGGVAVRRGYDAAASAVGDEWVVGRARGDRGGRSHHRWDREEEDKVIDRYNDTITQRKRKSCKKKLMQGHAVRRGYDAAALAVGDEWVVGKAKGDGGGRSHHR